MKTTLATVAVLIGILASAFGGIEVADSRYASAADFSSHLEAEQSRYVLELKQQIRDINRRLDRDPDNDYLRDELHDLIDTLCELRPDDRLCK